MKIKNLTSIKSLFLDNLTTKQTIFKNTLWLMLAEGISKLLMFFLTILIVRYLGAEGYGKFAFAFAFVALFAVLADFGLSTLTIREVARDKKLARKYIDNITIIKLILGAVAFGLIFIVIQFLDKTPEVKTLVYLVGIWMLIQSFTQFFQSIFRAFEKMEYEAVSKIIYSLALFCIAFLAIWQKLGTKLLVQGYIYAALLGLVITLILAKKKFTKFWIEIDFGFWKSLLKKAWPFALSVVAVAVYYRIDTVMLGVFKTDEAVGYYNAAYNIILIIISIIGLLTVVLLPTLSKMYKESIKNFQYTIYSLFELIFLLSPPLIIFIFFNSQLIVKIIYGQTFVYFTPPILQILIWSVLILYSYAIFAIGLSASDRQKTYLKGVACGAIFNTFANLILIPRYSYYGAAITTVLTEMIVCGYMSYWFLNFNKMKLPINFIWGVVLSAFLLILSVMFFNFVMKFNLFISSIIGLIIYVWATFTLRITKRNFINDIQDLIFIK